MGCSKIFLVLVFHFLGIFASCKTYAQSPSPAYNTSNTSFSSSTAVVMVVLVSVFFLLGFFSVYIRQCTDRRMTLTGGIDGSFIGTIGRRRGLDEAVINSFPTLEYSSVKWLKIGKGALECAVCLTEFEDDETLRLIPKCNHVFHPNCIDVWLSSHSTCPVCRANLVPRPEEMPFQTVDLFNSNTEPGEVDEPDRRSNTAAAEEIVHDQVSIHAPHTPKRDSARSPIEHSISPVQKITPIRSSSSRSSRFRLPGFLPRSHSTGHSLVQVGENWERFTLRLPEEVRNEIVNSSLHRSKSWAVLPRARSSRKGYRNGGGDGSSRGKYYDREVKPDRWGFSMTPPFISRTGPARSPKMAIGGSEGSYNNNSTSRTLLQSVKSPFDRLILGIDTKDNSSNQCNDGERSFDRLRLDRVV